LVGRDQELALLTRFVDQSATGDGMLLLAGEPGVGKTALLRVAAQHAVTAGARVLHVAGSEFDASVSFGGLVTAVLPLVDRPGVVLDSALSVALGLADGPPPEQTAVSQAVLALLRSVSAAEPVLVIVDDLQWLDTYSVGVLRFLVPRLAGSRVGILAASRSSAAGLLGQVGVVHHYLAPLDPQASEALLRSRFSTLAPHVRQRLLDEAEGNPLALLELPPALSGYQQAALRQLPAVLPLSERLRAVFASRVSKLPSAARELLLLAALDGTGDLQVLRAAVGAPVLDDLAPAEWERLVRVDDDFQRLTFWHPLIRSAVVELSTAAQRRRAHRALAEVLADQPARLARHLAASTDEPDDRVAATLEACARQMLHRGDATGAAAALTRAARLSADPDDRSRRLGEAAYVGGYMTLQFDTVPQLLQQTRSGQFHSAGALHATAGAAYMMLNGGDDIDSVHRMLVTAIEVHGGSDSASRRALISAMSTLYVTSVFGGRAELFELYHTALARLAPDIPTGLRLVTALHLDPARAEPAMLRELDAALRALQGEADPERILTVCTAAAYVDRLPDCREPLRWLIRGEHDGGSVAHPINARMLLCGDAFKSGRWDEADELAAEGLAKCEAVGSTIYVTTFDYYQALLAAVRGEDDRTQAITTKLIAWAVPRGARLVQVWSWHARAVAALGRGDFKQAYENLAAISPAGTFPAYEGTALWTAMDLVEAAIRTNRPGAARAHVEAMYAHDLPAISPRLALTTFGSAAMATDDDDEAVHLFSRALAVPGADRWPFDYARIQLAHGERLHRAHAGSEARVPLQAALATFDRLGARPWITRSAKQLQAADTATTAKGTENAAALTAQELEIANLAAAGLTNKQIGQQLHLSPRTVSTHLYRLFPKLGVTTRAALRDALTGNADPANHAIPGGDY
jgi:DNA-binding CsgD family transcriptional regulator